MNLSRITMPTEKFRQCMSEFMQVFDDGANDYDPVHILFVDKSGTSQSKAIAKICYEVMRSKNYFVFDIVHLSGPSDEEIKRHRDGCDYCSTQSAIHNDIIERAIETAAELDEVSGDDGGSKARTWEMNQSRWSKSPATQ